MKKILLFFFFLLMSVGSAFGASPATLNFTSACGGSGTDSDGNTWTVTSDADESQYDGTKGIHYGTGKKAVSYLNITTSGISGTITQIQVNASGASGTSAKLNVTVGGNAFGSQQSLTSSASTYTLTGSASGTIIVSITQSSTTKALYCKSIIVTYSGGVSYTITAQSNNNSYGTVSLSGNVITGSPKSGYRYADPAYTVNPVNSATVSQSGNAFTVTPSANTTVTINFEAIPTYTVTYNLNGGTGTTPTETNKAEGATFTLHDGETGITPPDGKMFSKWKDQDDNLFDGGDTYTMSGKAVTFTAQWVNEPKPAGKIYELVTDVSQLSDNDNVIIMDNMRRAYALGTTQNTNNRSSSQDFRLIMNKTVVVINDPSTVQVMRLNTENGGYWTLYTGDIGYLYAASSSVNYLRTQINNDDNGKWDISIDNVTGEALIVAQGDKTRNTIQYNSGSNIFSCYSSASETSICIFKESSFSETYTVTLINQLGQDSVKTQVDLGEIIKLPTSMNICNSCYSSNWGIYGWVTSLESTNPIYTVDYLPMQNTTLYALYGRGTSKTIEVEEYKKVTSALEDWSGDYLIAYSADVFADGRIRGLNNGGIGDKNVHVDPDNHLKGDTVIDAEWGNLYNITLEEISEGSGTYVMKTKDGRYNYRTTNSNGIDTTANKSTAANYPITVTFISSSDIALCVSGTKFHYNPQGYFRFYNNGTQSAVYLYKKVLTRKTISEEYSTAPECDSLYVSEWGANSITIPSDNLTSISNPTHITVVNIEESDTIKNKETLSQFYNSTTHDYVIPITNLGNISCEKLNMLFESNDDSLYVINKVPILISGVSNGNTNVHGKVGTDYATCDVVVLANSKLELTDDLRNRDVKIYESGALSIPSGIEYNVNTLSLRRTIENVPYFNLEGDMSIAQDSGLYIDVYTDESDWNWMVLPAKFDIRTLRLSNGKPVEFGEDYIFKYYDGAWRAEHLSGGWQATSPDKIFNRGEGFIFGIDAPIGVKKEYRFKFPSDSVSNEKYSKSVIGLYAYGNGTGKAPNHIGWNLIGNPFMSTFNADFDPGSRIRKDSLVKELDANNNWTGGWELSGTSSGESLRYAVIPSDDPEDADAGGYKSIALDGDYDLKPFTCFFVQLGGDKDAPYALTFGTGGKKNSIVARRTPMYDENEELFLRIKVGNRKTGWFISNKFTNEYEPGDDLESKYPIYQLIDGFKYLYSAIPDSTLINGVTVHSPGGTLTLDSKVDKTKFEYVYAKVGETWYNLLLEDVEVGEGNFIIYAKRKTNEDIPTGIDVIHPTNGTYKFMKNNVIYINKNNKIYTIIGNSIQ